MRPQDASGLPGDGPEGVGTSPAHARDGDRATVTVVGGGLAGCEAALQLATRGHRVRLVEMRPVRSTPAHQTDGLGELVCTTPSRARTRGTPTAS